jgi:hypothetical protein
MRQRTGNIRRSRPDRRYHDQRSDDERRQAQEPVLVKKILVTGDRDWSDIPRVLEELKPYRPGTILVHGDCRGADVICAAIGEALGFEVRPYPADWKTHPRAAGPIRNQQMLDEEHRFEEPIDLCLAFHDRIESSRGTADMLRRVKKAGIPWKLNTSHGTTSCTPETSQTQGVQSLDDASNQATNVAGGGSSELGGDGRR